MSILYLYNLSTIRISNVLNRSLVKNLQGLQLIILTIFFWNWINLWRWL